MDILVNFIDGWIVCVFTYYLFEGLGMLLEIFYLTKKLLILYDLCYFRVGKVGISHYSHPKKVYNC